MAHSTPVYGLRKPEGTDGVSVTTDIADNMDLIEAAIIDADTGKAASVHTHAEADVTSLVADLAGKSSTAHHAAHEPSGSDPMAVDAAAGTGSLRTLGTGAAQAAPGTHAHSGVYDPAGSVATHEADTTAIHGIANTSLLETTAGATTKVSNHAAAADPHTGYVLESLVDAKGDILTGTANDTPARLAVGSNDQVLTADSAQATGLKWATPSAAGIPATLLDAKGDLIAASAADTAARLAVGTDGQVLTAASGQSTGLQWATPSAAGIPATIVDAKGDIIAATAADTVARVAVGTDGQVLTADAASSAGVKWAAQSGTSVLKGVVVSRASQSINNVTPTAISWDTEVEDSSGFFTPTSTTITVPTGEAGIYAISARVDLPASMTNRSNIEIQAGGVNWRNFFGSGEDDCALGVTVRLAQAATVVFSLYQESGSARNVAARLEMWKVGT